MTVRKVSSGHRRMQAAALAAGVIGAGMMTAGGAAAQPPAQPAARTTGFRLAAEPFNVEVPAKVVVGEGRGAVAAAAATALPTFTKTFKTAGKTYTYTMVGTDPAGVAKRTTVANTITPVTLKFADGRIISTSKTILNKVVTSGMYTSKTWPGGSGQYGDVFMRTQFWADITAGAKDWHVLMAPPTVKPTLTITVPAASGVTQVINGVRVGLVDINWFDAKIQSYVGAPAANVLTQLLAGNVVMCSGECGIGGYHSVRTTATGKHTYSYQGFLDPRIYGATFANIGPMTHELAEWLADPYVDNITPNWTSPLSPQYGCVNLLEVGDPLVGYGKTIGGLFYQDEAYLAFFSRQSPSKAWNGRYSWFNTFKTYGPSC